MNDQGGAETTTPYSTTQAQRLRELGADPDVCAARFVDVVARDAAFRDTAERLARTERLGLHELRTSSRQPRIIALEGAVSDTLRGLGFVRVVTPHLISREALAKMGIDHGHPLHDQVFWVEDGRCLRPMLAPGLYSLMRRLARVWTKPFGIFEIGTCFRRDTKGASHLNEFTMLNLVELGGRADTRRARLDDLANRVMHAAGIDTFELVGSTSEVYGEMFDVEVNGMEVCSAALGPHALDGNWGIVDPWVGLGFGLERLLMARERYANIERAGRSLSYIDGARLNV